jgi:hypothetical protein
VGRRGLAGKGSGAWLGWGGAGIEVCACRAWSRRGEDWEAGIKTKSKSGRRGWGVANAGGVA